MSRAPRDAELDGLFGDDPELGQIAHLLRSVPHVRPEPDPAFRAVLRRRLMREAWEMREQQQQQKLPWYRRLFAGPSMAWAGGMVGVLLIALAALTLSSQHPTTGVVVGSPMANVQRVPVAEPIQLQFNQPMDRSATEQAIQIQPATRVTFQWPSAKTVEITPINGSLAPATRYQVTVTASARTASGQAPASPTTVSFVTAPPTPSPVPTATPSPGPVVTPGPRLADLHKLGLAGDQPLAWSLDGRLLYVIGPQGQLQAYSVAGGAAQLIAPDGVQMVAAGPAGPAYVRNGDLVYNGQTLSGANPLAIGFSGGRLVYVSGNQVLGADHSVVAGLNGQPAAASFSPGGTRLAYIDSSGLHLLDLSSSKDQHVPNVSSLGAWSPAIGSRYAYPTSSAVVVMTDGGGATRQVRAAGVADLSWSRDGQLLLAGPNGLYLVNAASGDPTRLSPAAISQPQWSPVGGKVVSYKQDGWVWIGQVAEAQPALTQDDVVSAFLDARRDRDAGQASTYLDEAGKAAFRSLTLVYGEGVLSRYQILLEEPGRVVVRLVTTQGGVEGAVDETLVLRRDAQGRMLIHGASDTSPRRPLGRGPEVVSVQVSSNQVRVTFDSDLERSTIGGVTVVGQSGSASYDKQTRTVTINLSQSLDSGSNYVLQVSGSLHDVGNRAALPFNLTFVGPAATASPTPSPTPSPTGTPSPTPTPQPTPTPTG